MSLRGRLHRRGKGGKGTNSSGGKNGAVPSKLTITPTSVDPADAAEGTAPFDLEVPILSSELLLAAGGLAGPVADRGGATQPGSDAESATPRSAEQLRLEVHRRVIDRLDLEVLEGGSDPAELAAQVRVAVMDALHADSALLSPADCEAIVEEVVYDITGLGPVEPLFRDPAVTEILVNGAKNVCVDRGGRLSRVTRSFRNDAHLLTVIDRILSRAGRRVDESSPIVDVRLPDGTRVNAIIPPLTLDGPVLSIRRAGPELDIEAIRAAGTLTGKMAILLAGCVHARLNVLVSGGTGSGKTALLNALSAFIPRGERVVTIEDVAELRLRQEHVVRFETRPPNAEGRGEVVARDLLRNALRMHPSRIIVGEVRGAEALDMLQAMSTGQEGSMATIHANSPRDALSRLENMARLGATGLPTRALREQIAGTIDVIVQIARLSDGRRRVVSITEVSAVERDTIRTNEIFAFRRAGGLGGREAGRFEATAALVPFIERLQTAGVSLPPRLFEESVADAGGSPQPADHVGNRPASTTLTRSQGVGLVDDRNALVLEQLDSTIQVLEGSFEQEPRATREAPYDVDELRAQIVASREELDVMRDEVLAARCEAEEQRELQAMLHQRSRSLAIAVLGFVEILDDVIDATRESVDASARDRGARLRDGVGRLLALFGLTEIEAVAGPVDETRHEVVGYVPSGDHPAGTVVAVVQRGFTYHGEPVRRAQVLAAE
jgi:pilus assembly protein CpaF